MKKREAEPKAPPSSLPVNFMCFLKKVPPTEESGPRGEIEMKTFDSRDQNHAL